MKALGDRGPRGLQRFVSQQIYYSLQARDAEYELVPVAIDQGLGVLVWSPLAGGLLSGKYRRGQARRRAPGNSPTGASRPCTTRTRSTTRSRCWSGSARRTGSRPPRSRWPTRSAARRDLGDRRRAYRASSWRTTSPPPTSTYRDERAQLDKVSAQPLRYPYWHQANTSTDRLGDPDLAHLRPYL